MAGDFALIVRARLIHATVAALVTAFAFAGCGAPEGSADPEPSAGQSPPAPKNADRLLSELRVAEREQPDTYDRDAFGSAWADSDGNGCNQRDDVLLRDVLPGTVTVADQDACDHDVLAGTS